MVSRERSPAQVGYQRGFTLIEVLIVVALIATMSTIVVGGTGMLSGTRLRSAASLLISSVRLGIARANATGMPVRLVFDLEERRVVLEETRGRMLVVKEPTEGANAGAEAATEAEQEATEYARGILDGPKPQRARFTPVASFTPEGGDGKVGRELGKGIRFIAVQTEHDSEPRVDGRAYLYFWPGGGTERAVIQLAREGETEGLTVMVSALTGRAKIERGIIQLEELRQDGAFDEREDE